MGERELYARALRGLILTFIRINTKHNVIARHSNKLDVYGPATVCMCVHDGGG